MVIQIGTKRYLYAHISRINHSGRQSRLSCTYWL